jgi:hypothetical protein
VIERFKRRVMLLDDSDDSCWIWVGALRDDGRGRCPLGHRHKERPAHRVAWELLNGRSIPKGMKLIQECDHPQCVRHWRLDRPNKVLTTEQVRQIRAAVMPAHALAVRYGVGTPYIRQIRCGAERRTDLTRQTSDGNLCA